LIKDIAVNLEPETLEDGKSCDPGEIKIGDAEPIDNMGLHV